MSTARETSCAGSSRTDRGRPAPPCTQKVLVSRSVPISLAVLACFDPQWPNLNFAVACFGDEPNYVVLLSGPSRNGKGAVLAG
jgi:hypothetical protein